MNEYLTLFSLKLKENNFNDEQIQLATKALIDSDNEIKTQKNSGDNEMLSNVILEILKNPESVKEIFKPDLRRLIFNCTVILILVGALVFLSYQNILGACETSTIFAAIVGYLIGNKSS